MCLEGPVLCPPCVDVRLHPAAVGDWEACGDAFFSREMLYDMTWEDTDLDSKRWVVESWVRAAGEADLPLTGGHARGQSRPS